MNEPTSSRCPRCQSALFEGRSGDLLVHGCGDCGGLWLDNDNARRAIDASTAHATRLSRTASRSARRPVRTSGAGLACPACAGSLERVCVAPSGVEVDLCQTHGTWFDRDELTIILRAAEPTHTSPFTPPPGYAGSSPSRAAPVAAPARRPDTFDIALQITGEVASNLVAVAAFLLSSSGDSDSDIDIGD